MQGGEGRRRGRKEGRAACGVRGRIRVRQGNILHTRCTRNEWDAKGNQKKNGELSESGKTGWRKGQGY